MLTWREHRGLCVTADEGTTKHGMERGARRYLNGSQFTGDYAGEYPDLLPPEAIRPPSSCPAFPAPHLLCCDALTQRRRQLEQRGPHGEPPAWTQPQPGESPDQAPYPRPPWVSHWYTTGHTTADARLAKSTVLSDRVMASLAHQTSALL